MPTSTLFTGELSSDLPQVIRQLRQDLKDDWYPDSLGYDDVLKPNVIKDLFTKGFERNHGLYVPEQRIELNIPKKNFVLRYSLEMSILDRLYYQALVGFLIPYYDALLPLNVLNHRYRKDGDGYGRYLFKQPIEQWKLFRGYVLRESENKPVVLITDLQNYYENIRISDVIRTLHENIPNIKASGSEKIRIRRVIDELHRCLKTWCYTETHGLPQNRDASSFLANLVMLNVDRRMLDKHAYYRYMDDIRIPVTDRFEARSALQELTNELRVLGLSVNSAKTRIVEPEMDGYLEALGQEDRILMQIDNMWRSRSIPVIRRSFAPLTKLANDLIVKNATQEPAFRFCVKRFENLALCSDFSIPPVFFEPITNICIHELDRQPFSSDNFVRLLKAAPTSERQLKEIEKLLLDEKRAIYDWQNYLLWQLLVYKGYRSQRLIKASRKRASDMNRVADQSGAILYLGAMGQEFDRKFIAQSFRFYESSLVQRNALIAIHELHYERGVRQDVKDYVQPCLNGTYKRLRTEYSGQYHCALPSVNVLDIYDEVNAYD